MMSKSSWFLVQLYCSSKRAVAQNWTGVALCVALMFGGGEASAEDANKVATATTGPCTVTTPCDVAPMHYIAVPPKNWNGRDKLRVAIWMHGYGRSARIPVRNKRLMQVFDKHNLLFVAPSGYNKGWSVPGTPQAGRDDVAYVADVLDDVARRFPITRDNSIALGFSLGGSLVWTLACQRPELFRDYVAFAGGFWLPHPKRCVEGPVNLLHIHGENDSVVPLLGRPIGSHWFQGDVPRGLKFWRASKACGDLSKPFRAPAGLTCRVANSCGGLEHAAITSCRHVGGHVVNPKWLDWALEQLDVKGD